MNLAGGVGTNAMILQGLSDSTAFDKKELQVMQKKFVEVRVGGKLWGR